MEIQEVKERKEISNKRKGVGGSRWVVEESEFP